MRRSCATLVTAPEALPWRQRPRRKEVNERGGLRARGGEYGLIMISLPPSGGGDLAALQFFACVKKTETSNATKLGIAFHIHLRHTYMPKGQLSIEKV